MKQIKNFNLRDIGWLCFFILFPLGNTSLGIIILIFGNLFGAKDGVLVSNYRRIEYRLLTLFTVVMLVSSLQALKPLESFSITVGQILVFILIFSGSHYLVQNREQMNKYLILLWISGVISGGLTTYKYVTGPYSWFRSSTLFTGINTTGTVLFVTVALSLVAIMRQERLSRQLIGYVSILAPIGGMLTTFSRGALLGFLGMLFTYLLRSKKMIIVFFIITVIIVSAIFTLSPYGKMRLTSIFSLEKNQSRLQIWEATFDMGMDNLLWGVGPGMYAYNYETYKHPDHKGKIALAHNFELQIFAEFGIFGVLFLFSFLILVFWRNIQLIRLNSANNLYWAFLASLIGILIHNQVDGTIMIFEVGAFFWFLCGYVIHEYYRLADQSSKSLS